MAEDKKHHTYLQESENAMTCGKATLLLKDITSWLKETFDIEYKRVVESRFMYMVLVYVPIPGKVLLNF